MALVFCFIRCKCTYYIIILYYIYLKSKVSFVCYFQTLHDDIIAQKSRVRDLQSTVKRLSRESTFEEDPLIKDRLEDLRQQMDGCIKQSNDQLNAIEQALPLARVFHETLANLTCWLEEMEEKTGGQEPIALTAEQLQEQQDGIKVSGKIH